MKNPNAFLETIYDKVRRGETLVMSGVGSGLTAMSAVKGGADILATYHTAAYRMEGVPSILSCMPYDNCNEVALRLLPQVLTTSAGVPVLVGLGAHDPRQRHEVLLDRVEEGGGWGVVNEPFVGNFDGVLRERLEKAGLGFQCELSMIRKAVKRGMLAHAWCFSPHEAEQMADAGAHFIGALVKANPLNPPAMTEILDYVQSIVSAVKRTGSKAPVLIHGNPVDDIAVVTEVLQKTGAAGYATGSSGERLPVIQGVSQTVAAFKSIRKGSFK